MIDKEKIIEAMKTIKAVCEEHKGGCSPNCPFYVESEECYISWREPDLWEINAPENTYWRAYI